jgi:hypothetical protein
MATNTRILLDTIEYISAAGKLIVIKLWKERGGLYSVILITEGQARSRSFYAIEAANDYICFLQARPRN